MKPTVLVGHRRYEIVWHIGIDETRFNASRSNQFDNGLKYGWITANSPQEAWEKAKSRGKRYGIRNTKTKEYYYPPSLVNRLQEIRRDSENVPF